MRGIVATIVLLGYCALTTKCETFVCHDEPGYDPDDGPLIEQQFTWLGALQYIHVKKGNPHYFRVPRVALISQQFALSTAMDASAVPPGYALGNVAFGDYERDEVECGLSQEDIQRGMHCDPAILIMPISDVLLHPEFKHFGVKTSIALLKLVTSIKSSYMLPVCLPYKNFLVDKNGAQTEEPIVHLDFTTDAPRDFTEEEKEVLRVTLIPDRSCFASQQSLYRNISKKSDERVVCTTGCGFHSGAPTLVHEHTGHWTIVAIATGAAPCPDPLRNRGSPLPPQHIVIHPYVPWITSAISGKAIGSFAKDDPFGFAMPRATDWQRAPPPKRVGWVGRWWLAGLRCFDRGEAAEDLYRFYYEIFLITPDAEAYFTYYLELNAPQFTQIVCVKIRVPLVQGEPRVFDLDTSIVKLRVPLMRMNVSSYRMIVQAWCHNYTESSSEED